MVYQEPMILQWDKVVTVISLTIIHRIILTRTIDLSHKMKKRVMALLVHNKNRWVGLSTEVERQGHLQSGQVTQ
jgi:hypothetical protein